MKPGDIYRIITDSKQMSITGIVTEWLAGSPYFHAVELWFLSGKLEMVKLAATRHKQSREVAWVKEPGPDPIISRFADGTCAEDYEPLMGDTATKVQGGVD